MAWSRKIRFQSLRGAGVGYCPHVPILTSHTPLSPDSLTQRSPLHTHSITLKLEPERGKTNKRGVCVKVTAVVGAQHYSSWSSIRNSLIDTDEQEQADRRMKMIKEAFKDEWKRVSFSCEIGPVDMPFFEAKTYEHSLAREIRATCTDDSWFHLSVEKESRESIRSRVQLLEHGMHLIPCVVETSQNTLHVRFLQALQTKESVSHFGDETHAGSILYKNFDSTKQAHTLVVTYGLRKDCPSILLQDEDVDDMIGSQ